MTPKVLVKLPKLGLTMQEATLTEWLVEEGASVQAGQPIYVLATDKIDHEVESPAAGVITLVGEAETTYQVGDVVAKIEPS